MKKDKSASLVIPGRFAVLLRNHGVYSSHDKMTGARRSLRTRDYAKAAELVNALNQEYADKQHAEALAHIFLEKAGRTLCKMTWAEAMEACWSREGLRENTVNGLKRVFGGKCFAALRPMLICETYAEHFREVLKNGAPSTSKFLRTLQCFAIEQGWLHAPLLPNKVLRMKKQKDTKAITWEEHQRIVASEKRPEWKRYYTMCWLVGGGNTDMANLRVENFNKEIGVLTYIRKKTGNVCRLRFNGNIARLLELLPESGWLFPTIRLLHQKQRSSEFWRRVRTKKVNAPHISLHGYRVSMAERLAKAGISLREAQNMLGHRSEAVAISYAKNAEIISGTPDEHALLDLDL